MSEVTSRIRWFREPLLHFLVLAGLLFALDYWARQQQKDEIVVSRQTQDYLIQQHEDLELRVLSDSERLAVIDQFIEDEILYAESYKRGLDRGDSRMRRNLILKMRGLLAGEVGEPTEAQLQEWYENNLARFTTPEYWSLQQVFYSDPAQVPADLLTRLNAGLDPASLGEERLDIRRVMRNMRQRDLVGLFGADTVLQLLSTDLQTWSGPFETAVGLHFVRLAGYQPQQRQSYEQIERYLAGEWMLEQTRLRVEQEVLRLRPEYDIRIEPAAEPAA